MQFKIFAKPYMCQSKHDLRKKCIFADKKSQEFIFSENCKQFEFVVTTPGIHIESTLQHVLATWVNSKSGTVQKQFLCDTLTCTCSLLGKPTPDFR